MIENQPEKRESNETDFHLLFPAPESEIITKPVYRLDETYCKNLEFATQSEWLLTNGIGGFASGTVSGIHTRRYHGHLISATNSNLDRKLVLAGIEAEVTTFSNEFPISSNQYSGAIHPEGYQFLETFESCEEFVSWKYRAGKSKVEKRLSLFPEKNACQIEFINHCSQPIKVSLKPLVCVRSYHGNFFESAAFPAEIAFDRESTLLGSDNLELWLGHDGAERVPVQGWYYRFEHVREIERGLNPRDDLYCPCELLYTLNKGEKAVLIASTDGELSAFESRVEAPHNRSLRDELARATSRFLVSTATRETLIAGYPWFTDWGRDTMISLPGICTAQGKHQVAKRILLDYAQQMRHGLIPNRFVEDSEEPEYNTVDATLWFVNAVYKELLADWDEGFAKQISASLDEVFRWYSRGTDFGIRMDPTDGLIFQGVEGSQLTWMDAKIGDWVVTPRHGKPIEVCGLWINALRIMEWLANRLGRSATRFTEIAVQAENSFEERFYCPSRGHYFDTLDPDDASLRPNQLIAMALPFSPAKGENALRALQVIEEQLLTPVGLRTLGPDEPAYRRKFEGGLQDLDAAYHQGTVWPWLLGSYVSAVVRLTGDQKRAAQALESISEMLAEYGLGGIAEVYDAEAPHRPNGCPWQAWSVAEIYRAITEDLPEFGN